jgi:glycosyltransferase involved in cell wall biosynthesis
MRILMVTPFYPPDIGGIAYHVFNIAKLLSKRHELLIIKNNKEYGIVTGEGIKIIKIPSLSPPPYPYQTLSSFRLPILAQKLKKIIKDKEVDLVHLHGHHYPITWLSEFYAKKYNVPTVLTLHGMYALNPYVAGGKTLLEEFFNKTIFKFILKNANSIIGLTKNIVSYAKKYGPKETKYYEIPNGINLDSYERNLHKKAEYRNKYGLPKDKTIVLFRGRFTHVKGVLEAAYAAKYAMKSRLDMFFLFVGNGPLKRTIENILNGVKNVKILDWTPTEAIHELYIASDIYFLPSKWEALPITLMEAMAARLYIVSTPVGGIPDVLTNYPLKTFIYSLDLKLMIKALNEASRKICVKNGMINNRVGTYIAQFDWRNIVYKIEQVYKAISK